MAEIEKVKLAPIDITVIYNSLLMTIAIAEHKQTRFGMSKAEKEAADNVIRHTKKTLKKIEKLYKTMDEFEKISDDKNPFITEL